MTHDDPTSPSSGSLREGVRITLGHLDEAFRSILRDEEGVGGSDGPEVLGPGPGIGLDLCIRRPADLAVAPDGCERDRVARSSSFRSCDGPIPDDCAALRDGRGLVA